MRGVTSHLASKTGSNRAGPASPHWKVEFEDPDRQAVTTALGASRSCLHGIGNTCGYERTSRRSPSERVYDVVVIGGGPVGVALPQRTRADGLSVVIVEKELLGGECDYWACVPSKPLLRPVVAIADARRVEGARKAVEGPLDAPAVFARREGFVFHWHDDQNCRLGEGHGCRPGTRPWAAGWSPAGGRRDSQRRAGGGLRPARGGRLHRQP